ncbi:MAG: hypothetical protein M0023_07450 [Desulfobacteraceae bacterium]|nr:hypothetical protein [Desulfobacteraceae bacterium]
MIAIAIMVASGASHIIRYLLKEQKNILSHSMFRGFLYVFPLFLFAAGLFVIKKYDNPKGYYLLSFAIYITCDYLLFKIIFKGSHESYSRFFILTVFILYMLLIGSTIIIDKDAVYKEPLNELKHYKVKFSDNILLNQAPLVILEANSNFFFFYDTKDNRSVVMQREKVEYVENLHYN